MSSSPVRTRSAWLIGTFFCSGYFPGSPGTAGSVAALVVAWPLIESGFPAWGFAALSVVVLYPAIRAADIVARESGRKDPQIVVIDEVLGQWLTLGGAVRLDLRTVLAGLVLFRIFDILKPPPVRQIERIPGGAGIVLDDMMAGVYGALVLFLLGWFNRL